MEGGRDSVRAAIALAQERGYVRPRDLAGLGVSRPLIARLVQRGILERVGYGLYRTPWRGSRRARQVASLACSARCASTT